MQAGPRKIVKQDACIERCRGDRREAQGRTGTFSTTLLTEYEKRSLCCAKKNLKIIYIPTSWCDRQPKFGRMIPGLHGGMEEAGELGYGNLPGSGEGGNPPSQKDPRSLSPLSLDRWPNGE